MTKLQSLIMRFLPIVPVTFTLLNMWASCVMLLKVYPGHRILYLGLAVTAFIAFVSVRYVKKGDLLRETLDVVEDYAKKAVKLGDAIKESVIDVKLMAELAGDLGVPLPMMMRISTKRGYQETILKRNIFMAATGKKPLDQAVVDSGVARKYFLGYAKLHGIDLA